MKKKEKYTSELTFSYGDGCKNTQKVAVKDCCFTIFTCL